MQQSDYDNESLYPSLVRTCVNGLVALITWNLIIRGNQLEKRKW